MKLNSFLQYIFFAMIIIGLFAAMARNTYGLDFIGVACFGISILYVVQACWKIIGEYEALTRDVIVEIVELLLLGSLTLFFGLRAFYIYVGYSEIIFRTVCGLLFLVYMVIGNRQVSSTRKENKALARNLIFIYTSVLFFLVSILTDPKIYISITFGLLAVFAAMLFIFWILKDKRYEIKSKSISLLQFVVASRNKAGILFLFFLSSALFFGLAYLKIVPSIENVDRPKDYIQLIIDSETGKEKPVDGHYKHERYKVSMDKFLKRHRHQ